MSERKVLNKYFPPDFDPSALTRTRKPKDAVQKLPTVRLMSPFTMQCQRLHWIYRGTKFNARKKITDRKYLSISIIQFFIKCPTCSTEICFETSPAENDYRMVSGAKRAFTPWNNADSKVESEEQRLDRLEREQAEQAEDAMTTLEGKVYDAQQEKKIADALDEIQMRNARNEKTVKENGGEVVVRGMEEVQREMERERERLEREDEEVARRAFMRKRVGGLVGEGDEDGERGAEGLDVAIEVDEVIEEEDEDAVGTSSVLDKVLDKPSENTSIPPHIASPMSFKRGLKRKKDFGAALGIKKKASLV